MLHRPEHIFELITRTIFIYFFLIVMLRLVGKRLLSQLNVIDLIVVLILGSSVQNGMLGDDFTLIGGLIAAGSLMVTNKLLNLIFLHFPMLRLIISGPPKLIIQNGEFVEENLKRCDLTHEDVMEALREHEKYELKDIQWAVLEADGRINIIPRDSEIKTGAPLKI